MITTDAASLLGLTSEKSTHDHSSNNRGDAATNKARNPLFGDRKSNNVPIDGGIINIFFPVATRSENAIIFHATICETQANVIDCTICVGNTVNNQKRNGYQAIL